jgi:CBS-domain-containing membrane protein
MFSVHGITGQVFSGTLEEMNRVRGMARARSSRPIDREDINWQVDNLGTAGNRPNEKAVQAYRSMLPREIERGPLYHAGQIMQREVICVGVEDAVGKAWKTLQSHNIHQAPVLDDAAQLVGMVGERELLTAINIETGKIMEGLARRVGDVMRTPVITAVAVTDIRRIAAAMLAHRIDGVPVTGEQGRLVGYLSRSDILRAVVSDPPISLWR